MAPKPTTTRSASTSPPSSDPFNLSRFLHAQDTSYPRALSEIRRGRKSSHWMWYIFPQLGGIAEFPSPMARRYAISSRREAEAYLSHPVLGARLREISTAVLESEAGSVAVLMGSQVDVDKLRSCLTLFRRVGEEKGKGKGDGKDGEVEEGETEGGWEGWRDNEEDRVFGRALERWFDGKEDAKTVELLEKETDGVGK